MRHINSLNELNDQLTIVDFYANWCGPCKMLSPILEEIAIDNKDIEIVKVDCDQAEELCVQFNINAIPALLMFKEKKLIDEKIGYMSYDDVQNWINSKKVYS